MKNVLEYLEQTAAEMPEKTAVIDETGEQTYGELLLTSQRVGCVLAGCIRPGDAVAVMMKKSIDTLDLFFGIVYAGGFYSLVDPDFPEDRIAKQLSVLAPAILIAGKEDAIRLRQMGYDGRILEMEDLLAQAEKWPGGEAAADDRLLEIRNRQEPAAPLYCNFTSGSTGVPKGVLVGHASVIEFIDDFTKLFDITERDVIGNQAPFDFDVSVKDIFSAVRTGATLVIIPTAYFRFPNRVMDMLETYRVTTLIWAVSALVLLNRLHEFMYKVPPAINKVLYSGEEMPASHLADWMRQYPDAQFINLYGPTEITCNCTYYRIDRIPGAGEKIPIGTAYPKKEVFLLDEEQRLILPTDQDHTGELCVAGNCLALGYYHNEAATKAAFVSGILPDGSTGRYYRTGDLACYRDGLLYFRGRRDFQIKHNGHRIEPEEIERAMNALEQVDQACCIVDEKKYRLVAFYAGREDKAGIVSELKKKLPEYMIPGVFRFMEELPLTKNGKVDRMGLKQLL